MRGHRRWGQGTGRLSRAAGQSVALAVALAAALLAPLPLGFRDSASAAEARAAEFEVGSLRTERSETFARADGSMRTVLYSAPVHYRDAKGNWRSIKNQLVPSSRQGYAFENAEAGFSARLKQRAEDGLVRFAVEGAEFDLSLEGATQKPLEKDAGESVAYKDLLAQVDLEYALLPTGLKETLVLKGRQAPSSYRFRLVPTAGSEFELVPRVDGGLDVRTPSSATAVAAISAPVVSESRWLTVDDDQGARKVLVDDLAAAGRVTMAAERQRDGSYLLTLNIDEKWLASAERVFPIKLDPTVTTAVDLQDGYWQMDCGNCAPDTTSQSLVVSKDGSGSYSNGTARHSSGVVFSLGEIPAGASISSARLDMYLTGCYATSCGFWPPENGIGQSGSVEIRRFSGPWGPATTTSSLAIDATLLATRSFSMWWAADQPSQWKSWEGSALTSHVQSVVNGATPNYGLQASLAPAYWGWGPVFASSEYADPSKAPKLEVQWVADGVQLNPSTNIHSDGPELTWSRFAAGYGPYTTAILSDSPRAYWRMNDAAGSPFGVADWSGNSLHATPTSLTYGQAGKTADGDTSIYFNGSSSRMEAGEAQIADTFTIEAWVKRSTTGARHTIFSRAESNGGGFRLLLNASNYLELAQGDFNGTVATSTATIADTAWHHVAATKSGASVHLYIDGTDVTGTVNNYTMTAGVGVVVVGAMRWYDYQGGTGINYGDFFNGWIDEPAVFPAALSAARVQAHYAAASAAGSGFVRFEVHRSPSSGFTPSASTLLATLKDPVTQFYRDTTAKASASFYYKVVTVGTGGSATSNELTVATPAAGNATITVQPGVSLLGAESTTIAGGSGCANNGGAGGITASATQRALLRFDLRQIPTGSTITDADVSLWTFQHGGGQTINLQRATADWAEGTGSGSCDGSGATWSDRQANVPWASAGGEYETTAVASFTSTGTTPHWETADITSLVGDWVGAGKPNFGLLFKHASEAGATAVTWTSDEYAGSPALRPKLVVTYADGSDPKEPTVTMGAPGAGAKLSGSVSVTAKAGDDSKVTQLEFLQGTTVFATDTSAPWTAALNTASLANGSLDLKARATDDVGQVTTSSAITVTVANSAPPATSVTGATGTSTLTVNASASDDVSVSKVEFYVDGDRFATDSSSPYQTTLDTLAFPVYDGAHTLTSRAYDADGNTTTSAGYAVTVANTAGTKYQADIASAPNQSTTITVPVGTIVPYVGSPGSVPSGWALAEGTAVSRTTYSDLFDAISTAYGTGDGSTTFNLPNLEGRIPLAKTASGTGSTLGASGGALDKSGTATVGSIGYSFSFTDTAPNPTFGYYGPWNWYGAGAYGASDYPWIGMAWSIDTVQLGPTQSGTVVPRSVTAAATASVTASYGPASNPPYRVIRYIVKVDASASAPPCALWATAATSQPSGTLVADGQAASGTLSTCLDSSYSGNLPDLRGRFALGKSTAGTGSTINASGGSLSQSASVSLDTASTQATATTSPSSWALNLTISAPSPGGASTGTTQIQSNSQPLAAIGSVGNVSAGSINGNQIAATTAYTPGGLTTTAASAQTVTSDSYTAPFLALPFDAYTGSSYNPAIGSVTPYGGSSVPSGWLKADGGCVPTATYPTLFTAIGYTYGGSGASFCLPDLRGRFALGQSASGTGSTLGATGGTLDATPSAALTGWTPQITVPSHSWSWSIPNSTYNVQVTSSSNGGCNASCYQGNTNKTIVTGANGTSYASTAAGAQTVNSSTSSQNVNATATGGQNFNLPAQNPAYQVVSYLIASGPAAVAEAFIPSDVRYDASAGTQEQNRTTVYVTNNSSVTWSSASVYLRYRWIAPDGTVTGSSNVSLGSNVAPSDSAALQLDFDPPALPSGALRALYTLRLDLVDTSTGTVYFASQGNKPLERQILVTAATPLELGLERYQQYEPLDLGGGLTASANLATGNLVVSGSLVDNPGRGLSTLLDLAYNSQEPASFAPAGNGISLGTGLARLGQPLDIHPNASDTALGRTTNWVGFADGDGSYHRFVGRTLAGGHVYYDEPAGVHLYLRATGSADPTKYWALTRPDRVTFYFNQDGWPTRTEDADANALVYTLAAVASGEDAYGLGKRITTISDAAGRDLTLAYYSKAETATPALRGKLKTITDHSGLVTRFAYYDDGNLMRVSQDGGVGDDGGHTPARSLVFTYTTSAGTGPAISTLAGRQDPDPATAQGRLLYSLIDYRGNETAFAYSTTGATANRLSAWTDRAGKTTSFTYNTGTATTTVARPLSRTSSYVTDANGRVTSITNPLGLTTAVSWTSGNNVDTITNNTTGRSISSSYNANGYLTSVANEKGDQTKLTYQDIAVDADDVSGNWPAGRSIAHISQLQTRTLPAGVATTGTAHDYEWSLTYTSTGRLATVTDPLGNVTTNSWNANGTLATTTLPDNGDATVRTTTYETYDSNGLPTQVKDAAGNHAKAGYGADGRPLWTQDPIHYADSGTDTRSYRQLFDYDGYGRPIRTSTPKSSTWTRGLLVWSETRYDANSNIVAQVAPYYAIDGGGYGAVTTAAFDAMDRATSVVGPRGAADGGPVEAQSVYDDAGRVIKSIAPKGVATAATDDYTVVTVYDLLDRPATESHYQLNGTGAGATVTATRTTAYCYDAAGDLRSVTGPKGASGFSCPSVTGWPYTPTSQAYTTKVAYDPAHQPTSVTNPLGKATTTEYDANGWVTKVTDALSKDTTFDYNQRGDRTKVVEPFDTGRNITSLSEYDALGNVKRQISPRAYDVGGASGPWNDYVTSYSFDALGRQVRTSLPKAVAQTQTYSHNSFDQNGRLVWVSVPTDKSDPAQVAAADKTLNEYWDTGGLYSTTVGGSQKVRYDYTADGWQLWRLPETAEGTGVADYGRMMFWEYLPDGLLRAERDLAGQRSSYTYDQNANRTGASEAQSIAGDIVTVTSTFDGFDQLETVKTPKIGSSDVWKTSFAYDLHGNVTQLDENRLETSGGSQLSGPRVFTYGYDNGDQPAVQTDDFGTSGTDTDDERFSFTFDDLGRLAQRKVEKRTGSSSYATEQTQDSTYFWNGLVKTLVSKDGAGSPNTVASHSLSYITGGVYLNGNKAQDVFRLVGPDVAAPCRTADCTASWEYDGQDRLSKEVNGSGTTSEFTLDIQGNVTLEKRNGSAYRTSSYTGQRLSTTTESGITLKYLYDAQGNVDCIVLGSWGSNSCPTASTGQAVASELVADNVYDYRDRLVAVRGYNSGSAGDKTEYRYDPLGRPVKKTATEGGTTTTTDLVYLGVSDSVVRETETGASTTTRSYAFDALGDRATISETVSGTTSRWSYLNDPLGSAELLIDQSNTVKAAYGYTAYGDGNGALTKTAAGFTPNTNLYRYTGKRWDPAAKAYDMGARTYSPGLGRWFQQDRYTDGLDNLSLSTDPLTQNRYAFTAANPVNYVELDGHVAVPAGIGCRPRRKGETAARYLARTRKCQPRPVTKTAVRSGSFGKPVCASCKPLFQAPSSVLPLPGLGGTGAGKGGKGGNVLAGALGLTGAGVFLAAGGGGSGGDPGNGPGDRSDHDKPTVRDILKGKKGSITRAPLPPGSPSWDDVKDLPLSEVERRARANVPGYKTIGKLLKDRRFDK